MRRLNSLEQEPVRANSTGGGENSGGAPRFWSLDSKSFVFGEVLIKTGDWEHAFASASKAAARNPNSARSFYLGAKELEKLDKSDLCLNWLQRAVALNPDYSEPRYLLIRVLTKLGRTEEAEQSRKKFLEIKARSPQSVDKVKSQHDH